MTIITFKVMDLDEDHRPKTMVFSKIEKIIQDMQEQGSGIPVRCQKIFLTTIPCAFTGYDLIEWLMERLETQDTVEAIHLANLLCQLGYIFPVTDTRSCSVKDDNTLYRFQSPYFWPSKNSCPDNVDYAIYLTKRTLRNKQRHGLDEHEHVAYNKLQKMLCDKWEFINMQAEEQVRLSKERKKADKVVVDSQEKAFWRLHRPPPGQMKALDDGIKRHLNPSKHRKKRTLDNVKKQVDYLKQSLNKPRMKSSKTLESLTQHCETYYEHDPFLSGALPSNPWMTDDTTHWIINSLLVETPTERRVKRWAFDIRELIRDTTGRHEFEMYLKKEYSQENIRFWQSCEELKFGPNSKVKAKVEEIYREFLAPGAPCEVNIDCKTMELTQQALKKPSRYTFEHAQEHIFILMKKDSYQRFLRSDHYKNLLATAVQPCSKKKFFTFGTGKKKTPVPSPQPKRRGSTSSERNSEASSLRGGSVLGLHSYSTGNLQELDGAEKPHGNKSELGRSDVSNSTERLGASPSVLRKKLDSLVKGHSEGSPQRQANLDVPKQYPITSIEQPNETLTIAVPSKGSLVAPWEDQTTLPSKGSLVAPWEDQSSEVTPWESQTAE